MSRRTTAPPPVLPGYRYVRPLGSSGFADVFLYEQDMPRRVFAGDYDEVIRADHVYDPWWRPPVDPEASRTPTPTVDVDDIRERRE